MRKYLVLIICFFLVGCTQRGAELPLHQTADNVVKIELSDHRSGERVVLLSLGAGQIGSFLDDLRNVKCYQYFNDPPIEVGYLSITVYYQNGDIDILGTDICDYISEMAYQDGWIHLDFRDTQELFGKYVKNFVKW